MYFSLFLFFIVNFIQKKYVNHSAVTNFIQYLEHLLESVNLSIDNNNVHFKNYNRVMNLVYRSRLGENENLNHESVLHFGCL